MNKSGNRKSIRLLAESAMLIALSTVLSMIQIFKMPLGGSVTLISMLPVMAVSVRHGPAKGFAASFVYSLLQLMLGIVASGLLGWGLTPSMLIGCIALDYILAFTSMGLAGVFRRKGEAGIYAGVTLAIIARLFFHVLSGYVIFKNLEQWELFGAIFESRPLIYSICYNSLFMLPELLFTLAAVAVLLRVPYVKKNILTPVSR